MHGLNDLDLDILLSKSAIEFEPCIYIYIYTHMLQEESQLLPWSTEDMLLHL